VNSEDDSKIILKFGIISILIFIIILLFIFFNNSITNIAYVNQDYLDDEWFENLEFRTIDTRLFGLEKWITIRYDINSNYTTYLTITTVKTLVLLDENELSDKIEDIIESMLDKGIIIDKNSKINGERFLESGHKSIYKIFDGVNNKKKPNEKVKIIAEIWNCGIESKTIITLGYSQITDNYHNNSNINYEYWQKIVGDQVGTFGEDNYIRNDGLIYNIVCH
jgi:hypothetical protein